MKSTQWRIYVVAAATTVACSATMAQTAKAAASDFQASIWASSCMACHGTDGRAEGTGLKLVGKSEAQLHEALLAFKQGRRTASIMHQHAKGYSDDELRRIARYFAEIKP
jgi:cytochrome c553